MMAQSVSLIVLVAALLINTLSYCSAENVYCVTSTATSCSSCPHNTPCGSLSEYAREAELYFTSNTTMVFLPGDHILDVNITVANVSRLTIRGESFSGNVATVVRNGSVGFSFTNMVDFNIYSLAFTSYNRSWSHGSHTASNSALLLRSTQNAKLVNCFFHDNLGTALTVHNTSITLEGISKFIQNKCACQSFSDSEAHGCAIAALSSNLTFSGNTSFHENTQTNSYCGGAIWASGSSLHFNGTNNFINNSVNGTKGVGGAIHAQKDSSLSFSGTSNFAHNSAEYGGAITTIGNVVVTFNGYNNFIGNTANNADGAIYTSRNTVLNFTGTSNFIGNHVTGYNGGGAIRTFRNVALTFNGINNFVNNSANSGDGGALYASDNTVLNFTGTSKFINNSADYDGGAIYTHGNATLTFNGTNNFVNNTANNDGGAIAAYFSSILTFHESNNFVSNTANNDGGVIAAYDSILTFHESNNFVNNTANNGGAIVAYFSCILTFHGTNKFINNSADYRGGAIYTHGNVVLTFNRSNNFVNNSADNGGAIFASDKTVLNFTGTSNFIGNHVPGHMGGGAIRTFRNVALTFNGTNNFVNNTANFRGGAILARTNISLTFIGNSNFSNNSAQGSGGAIYVATNISLSFSGTSNFSSNSAIQGGAIFAIRNSTLTFNGDDRFTNNGHTTNKLNINNGVSRGGAMFLGVSSFFSVLPHTTVHWCNNHANLGGAIYVSDANPSIYCPQAVQFIPNEKCFFQLSIPGQNLSGSQLVFKNNSASDAGSVLYGGAIDKCKLNGLESNSSGELFDMLIINNNPDNNTTSNISSDPIKICPCKNNLPNCRRSRYAIPSSLHYLHIVYPGETIQISVVTVGQRNGTVPSIVRSTVTSDKTKGVRTSKIFHPANLLDYQYLQQTNNTCTKLNYTVFSLSQKVKIELYPEGSPCSNNDGGLLDISIDLNQTCPLGFNISKSARSCVCEQRLAEYTNQCNITNGVRRITRDSGQQFWVGYDHSSHELILHPHCPLDYCVNETVVFPLNNTDVQCAHKRSSFLCGACKGEYSLVLGTHQCRKCTNTHLALLIPFALMGVALVFLLLVCKLTVATGTHSGLVLYANIVGANHTIFLPVKSTDALSVFIAWLNLDLGIETCFYDGMDAYSKTWLQFVFPVYIWVLVGLMILVSHYSQKFAKLLGSNPVSVLATLILLSYAKILRTLIIVVYITYLEYPGNYNRGVWLYDANIDYLVGKHIPLFLVSVVVFLFLFLPYTLLLLFGQWLQSISHLRLFSWVNNARLKPFMDSYHAPYKAKHRYWPGLLLVLRFVLLLVFAFNHKQNFSINLLAIVAGAGILQLWALVSGGVYKNWCLDALEGSFMLNLIILAAATYHVKVSKGNQLVVGYTSVSITLGTLIVILFYHIFQQVRHTKLWKKVPKLNMKFKKLNTRQVGNNLNNPINDPTESVNLDQFREPWLEDLLQPTHSSL